MPLAARAAARRPSSYARKRAGTAAAAAGDVVEVKNARSIDAETENLPREAREERREEHHEAVDNEDKRVRHAVRVVERRAHTQSPQPE